MLVLIASSGTYATVHEQRGVYGPAWRPARQRPTNDVPYIGRGFNTRTEVSKMPRMNRAGREPADDVKKRIIAACRDAESKLWSATMRLRHEHTDRLIQIDGSMPERAFQQSVIDTKGTVGTNGKPASKFTV